MFSELPQELLEHIKNVLSHSVVSDSLRPHGLPGSSVHGIFLANVLEWVAISSSGGDLPDPGTEPGSSALQVDSLLSELPGKPKELIR